MQNTNKIKILLNKFKNVQNSHLTLVETNELTSVKSLLASFKPFLKIIEQEDKKETPHYNLFTVLHIEYLEAQVHTPFLKNLFDINGSHSQKELFLFEFLEVVLNLNKTFIDNLNVEYFICREEYKISNGRIDIILFYNPPFKEDRFVVIIENKIFATDQKDQIKRYYEFCSNELKLGDHQIHLIYLTPTISLPSLFSISAGMRDKLIEKNILHCVGYNPDIIKWLLKCIKKLDSVKLISVINQYIELINLITNTTYEY